MNEHEHEEITRQSFARQVGLFTGEDSPFARRPASTLAWLEPLDDDMIVLDIACGAAHAAEVAAPHVRQIVGIDLTPALLALGTARLESAGIRNVLLQEGNANALPFVDNSFDLVFCRTALHHFPEPATPVAEMARVCRPNGRVALSDMIVPSADVRDAFDTLHRHLDPSHTRALLEAEIAELMQREVGPLTYGETTTASLPLAAILTDAADRDATMTALEEDLRSGSNASGFDPKRVDGQMVVSFSATVVHASPAHK